MPFSETEFFDLFARYNLAIWPLQIAAFAAGVAVVGLLFFGRGRIWPVFALLAALWAVNGIGYHALFFSQINPVAYGFAVLFLVEAALLAAAPALFPDLTLRVGRDLRTGVALGLIVFAMVVYPLWGYLAGHRYPAVPAFGVAPCPTVIFTLGALMLARGRRAAWLSAVPMLWAVIGGSAAVLLGVPQDFGLIAALVLAAAVRLRRA
ncbi:DUF6064 family protein [Actibacterium sp. MT2.3-13A]|uniref:DUF6064 family protein n=1 Tax=Actibacterium sp. MT2.3-13A TaxID=2828332 RepID=UPI001BA48827|nr:DUF6064 family protein [Actibacterium sp. MT2.3-13A]